MDITEMSKIIEASEQNMIDTLSRVVAIRSISPLSGGEGESKRADFLESLLKEWGLEVKRYDYKDETGAARSNLVSVFGTNPRTIWIVAHIDTVSEGDMKLWDTNPFEASVKDGKIYGRGTLDNGQAGISALYALKALKECNMRLKYNFGMVFVADEELGSKYGIQKLLKEGIFKTTDMYIVPDWGTSNGADIEVAEKSILWLKITVKGKQVHASTPDNGKNAYRYSIKLLNALDSELHARYAATNPIFEPKRSTFEMTKHEKNVDSVNIIPGTEVSYIDCRILPQYDVDEVISFIKSISEAEEFKDVNIKIETFNREDAAPPTDQNAEIVKLLLASLQNLRGAKSKAIGIGGGTCAGFFRHEGMPSVVWSTVEDIAHQPNEYAIIKNMVDDSKVLASLFI